MKIEIVAEIGWNFMGDMDLARSMINEASKAGATIAKFQYWNPKKLKPGPWDNDGRKEIYEKAALNAEKIILLKEFCEYAGIGFLISAFNKDDASFISNLEISEIKIPSHETGNAELHTFAAQNFNKVYCSLGASTEGEVELAGQIYNSKGTDWVAMHCVSSYPLSEDSVNFPRMSWMKEKFSKIGFSDHTQSVLIPSFAAILGACVIEKHFTVDKNLPGRDNKFALNPKEFLEMVTNIRIAENTLIYKGKGIQEIELDTYNNYRGRWG